MKNPTLLKANVSREEAEELMDYLYCERSLKLDYETYIEWVDINDVNETVAKWTEEYKNIMISKDFLLTNQK